MRVQNNSYRFLFDGKRIEDYETVGTLIMKKDDVIDAMVTQTGGN